MAGLAATFGSGAMTNSIAELEEADCTLVTGSNTTETHPVISTRLKRALRLHHKSLIVIDPRRLDLVRHATIWLRQRPGTKVAHFVQFELLSLLLPPEFPLTTAWSCP